MPLLKMKAPESRYAWLLGSPSSLVVLLDRRHPSLVSIERMHRLLDAVESKGGILTFQDLPPAYRELAEASVGVPADPGKAKALVCFAASLRIADEGNSWDLEAARSGDAFTAAALDDQVFGSSVLTGPPPPAAKEQEAAMKGPFVIDGAPPELLPEVARRVSSHIAALKKSLDDRLTKLFSDLPSLSAIEGAPAQGRLSELPEAAKKQLRSTVARMVMSGSLSSVQASRILALDRTYLLVRSIRLELRFSDGQPGQAKKVISLYRE